MAESTFGSGRRLDFSLSEVTGAVGDSITVLPVAVAVAALTDLELPVLLLGFAVFQVVWGLHYGIPVSVEPMKALAALVLAGTLTTGEFVTAGLLGVVLVLVAVELGRAGLDTDDPWLAVGIGVFGLLTNVGVAFVAGVGAWWLRNKV